MNLWKRLRELLIMLFRRALRGQTWYRKPVVMSLFVALYEGPSFKTVIVQ
jgi:hypothetical protein